MKKLLCIALSAILTAGAFASCSTPSPKFSPKISVTSSDAEEYATWLTDRLGTVSEKLTLGTGDSAGIDMTDFENDGYVIRNRGDETVISGKTGEGLDLAVRKYAKAAGNGVGCEDTVYHEGYRIERLTIADVDISEYTVFYSPDANENMKFAVAELQRLVKQACGADLKAVQGEPVGEYTIEFKFSTDEKLKDEGYIYTVDGTHLTFEGAVKRGCMYAVWRFLQNECGWDSLIQGDSFLEEAEHVNVPDGVRKSETPAFEYLNLYYNFGKPYKNDKAVPSEIQSSYAAIGVACHGLQNNRFCDEDYWSRQICYTDEDRYEECIGNVRLYIESKLNAGNVIGANFTGVDISQGDSAVYCSCSECRKVFNVERSNAGAVVRFANTMSEELDRDYPGLVYLIFAYAESNVPPAVTKPSDIVYTTYCTDSCCSNHILDGSECGNGVLKFNKRNNKNYATWLEGWCDISENIYVWHYALDQGLMQYTVIENMYEDFKYFAELGVRGVFFESEHSGMGEHSMMYKLITEQNWNMDMTEEEYEALFCHLLEMEYGEGWTFIREYFKLWNESQDRISCWHCWGGLLCQWCSRMDPTYYDGNFDKMIELLETAIDMAGSKEQQRRAELFSCHMYYEGCYAMYYRAEAAGDTALMQTLSDRYRLMIDRLSRNGVSPEAVIGVGTFTYSRTIEEAAAVDWLRAKDNLLLGIAGVDEPIRINN